MQSAASVPKFMEHPLFKEKLIKLAYEVQREITQEKHRIEVENRGNLNSQVYPFHILQMQLRKADDWAGRTYQICRDTCKLLGEDESPEFLRFIFKAKIAPLLKRRATLALEDAQSHSVRTGGVRTVSKRQVTAFELRALRLLDEWKRKVEIDALEAEAIAKIRLKRRALITERHYPKNRKSDPRKSTIAIIKADSPDFTTLGICRLMDNKLENNKRLAPLRSWSTKSKERTWVGNYRHDLTTSSVSKYVSLIAPAGGKLR